MHAPSRTGVGALLRESREQRGVDIEGVARALRIRQPYLIAIEEGRFKDLPGAPYASGFVRSYAEYLSLDADEILRRFREESGGAGARTELVFPAPVSEGGFPTAVLIVLVILVAAAIYGVWYFYQWRHGGSAESVSVLPDRLAALIDPNEDKPAGSPSQAAAAAAPVDLPAPSAQFESAKSTGPAQSAATKAASPAATPAAPAASPTAATPAEPSPAPVVVATAAPAQPAAPAPQPAASDPAPPATAAVQTPAPATAAAPSPAANAQQSTAVADATPTPATNTAPPAPDIGPPSRVVLKASDDCWIEIRDASGAVVTARLLHRGDAYPVPPHAGETLTVGNAGAIVLLLDGSPLPPLGKIGMVRHDVAIDPEHLTGQPQAAPTVAATPAPVPAPPVPATPPAADDAGN